MKYSAKSGNKLFIQPIKRAVLSTFALTCLHSQPEYTITVRPIVTSQNIYVCVCCCLVVQPS